MPVINSIAAMQDEMAEWRQDIHAHPELAFEEVRTSQLVADKLESWGHQSHPRPGQNRAGWHAGGHTARRLYRPAGGYGCAAVG